MGNLLESIPLRRFIMYITLGSEPWRPKISLDMTKNPKNPGKRVKTGRERGKVSKEKEGRG